jgi:hypothetical protein
MFSDRAGFDDYHAAIGEHCDYDAMRTEVVTAFFHFNSNFTFSDMLLVPSAGSEAGDPGGYYGGSDGHYGGHGH